MNVSKQGNLEYHDHVCIRWKVDCDLNFVSSESNIVLFRKSELTIRLIKPNSIPLLVMQMRSDPILEGIYEIEIFLLDNKNSKFHSKKKFSTFDSPFYAEVWSIDRKLIHSNLNSLVTNGILQFVCIINFSTYRCLGRELEVTEPTDSSLEKLSVDISKLYKCSDHSDISLKCGDIKIPAHKFLLSARSDVFAAMFKSDMIECHEGIIDIQDIELPILDHLIKYMYTGKMDEISADTAMLLYAAADKYAVLSLKMKCKSVIFKEFTAENACDVLVLADAHADENLKNHVFTYLQRDQKFILSDNWKSFSKDHPHLAVEAYDFYVRRMFNK